MNRLINILLVILIIELAAILLEMAIPPRFWVAG